MLYQLKKRVAALKFNTLVGQFFNRARIRCNADSTIKAVIYFVGTLCWHGELCAGKSRHLIRYVDNQKYTTQTKADRGSPSSLNLTAPNLAPEILIHLSNTAVIKRWVNL